MSRQRKGSILNITSIGAIRALPTSVHYATSKAAVIGFTKCLSREAATFGITVNAIAAGIFDTDLGNTLPDRLLQMHEFWVARGRVGRPSELAEYAAFMVSDRNSFMNGEVVIIDGGAVTKRENQTPNASLCSLTVSGIASRLLGTEIEFQFNCCNKKTYG